MLRSRRFAAESQLQSASRDAPPLRPGITGAGVAALQDALVDLGYKLPRSFASHGRADGIYGPETEAAVRTFQTDECLAVDGRAGTETLGKLDDIIVDTPGLDSPCPGEVDRMRRIDGTKPYWLRRNYFW